jgi:hypothetical protein
MEAVCTAKTVFPHRTVEKLDQSPVHLIPALHSLTQIDSEADFPVFGTGSI